MEGVIKFDARHQREPLPQWTAPVLRELNAWRGILFALGLIGQDGVRYGGAAWGNVSARLPPWHDGPRRPFLVSGTQTGGLAHTGAAHYAVVDRCDVTEGRVHSYGAVLPSSEAMTHAMVYAVAPDTRFVFHAHCPEVWRAARRLELPRTPEGVDYGTREMAWAVERLLPLKATREAKAIVMTGHEDGVLTFGASADEAGEAMVRWLARARALTPRNA
ncbi:MAG: class II aldolase/adducin family protein [Myxococcota bacterium]|jgi:ribulose-5-phosphate 4-epimerase/fuculose-1-phosphate aldolase